MRLTIRTSHLVIALLVASACWLYGQGSLTPPGAPAPTMKTLDQIEARTPLAGGSTAITISAQGSYYLTGSLTVASGDAITITAANVTLDLGGFTIATTATTPGGYAVKIAARRVTVSNGIVAGAGTVSGSTFSGGGFANGVVYLGPIPQATVVRNVLVTGCSTTGIGANLVEGCNVQNVGVTGINGRVVRGCQADTCGGTGINSSVVSDCVGSGYAYGISCGTLANSSGYIGGDGSATGIGLNATTVQNCVGSVSAGGGTAINAVTATNCQGTGDSGIGLQVTTGINCSGTTNTGTAGVSGNVLLGSQGTTTGNGTGLVAANASTNCYGMSHGGNGLQAPTATTCFGRTDSSLYYGFMCYGVATSCVGTNTNTSSSSGAFFTTYAIGCYSGGQSITTGYKYLMP